MDSIFHLPQEDRATFLRHMMHFFQSNYICLWSHSPHLPSNCLLYLDGLYEEEIIEQPSSSSSSLFNAYCGSLYSVDHGRLPGFAFKNNIPYMEIKFDYIQTLASTNVQLQFYQEAGIKSVVFMGCASGEIELGFSREPQVNIEMEMRNWFPVDFSTLTSNQNLLPITSSSSLGFLSVDESIQNSPSLFNIPTTTSFITEPSRSGAQSELLQETLRSDPTQSSTTHILAPIINPRNHDQAAFRTYNRASLGPVAARTQKQSMFRRAVSFFRNLNMSRGIEIQIQENQPTTTQLHHMIQERRRREKINENLKVLRTLLPQVSKKDKASVLSSTTKYLSSLKSQVEELRKRNHLLETQLWSIDDHDQEIGLTNYSSSDHERVNVEIAEVSASTSEVKFLDVRVSLSSGECRLFDLVIRILKLLKQQRNVCVLCVESTPVHGLLLRLKVEGNEFDEYGFREAVRRVVEDPTH